MHNAGIAGIGCSLIDYLYPNIDFNGPEIISCLSQKAFDGGLIPGGLVFVDELEKFTGLPIDTILRKITKGKKPGCGDNFAGGVLSSIAYQLFVMKLKLVDLPTACAWGMASGGFACFYRGGTYPEKRPGEKKEKIRFVFDEYQKQTANMFTSVHNDFL